MDKEWWTKSDMWLDIMELCMWTKCDRQCTENNGQSVVDKMDQLVYKE